MMGRTMKKKPHSTATSMIVSVVLQPESPSGSLVVGSAAEIVGVSLPVIMLLQSKAIYKLYCTATQK